MPSSDEETGRQVQFGRAAFGVESSSSSSESSLKETSKESEDNINERLRHQASPIQIVAPTRLNDLMALVSVVVIHDCYQEIAIIRELNKMPLVEVNLDHVSLLEKYNAAEYDVYTVLYADESYMIKEKFKADISWIEIVLKTLIGDLKKNSDYTELEKILNEYQMTMEEEQTLTVSREFNIKELRKLRYYIDSEKREMTRMIQNITEKLGNYKDQLNDDIAESTVKIEYIKQWEQSRSEQNKIILQKQETNLTDTAQKMGIETEIENRVHDEMWLYLDNSMADYKDDIENWMNKYDQDLEEKEQQVETLKIKLENQRDEYAQILAEYKKRQEEIDDYKAHKEELRKEAEELARKNKAATKIQAWWRGTMYRKGLGPYRKKKGKHKKGGSGKKKK